MLGSHKIVGHILKMLTRRGALVREQDSIYVADDEVDSDDARTLRPLQAAAAPIGSLSARALATRGAISSSHRRAHPFGDITARGPRGRASQRKSRRLCI
jgi:hypothetical protein